MKSVKKNRYSIYEFFQNKIYSKSKIKKFTKVQIKKIFNENNITIVNKLHSFSKKLLFLELNQKQTDIEFQRVKKLINDINDKSSKKRMPIWNEGWNENYSKILKKGFSQGTIPGYYLRKNQRIFKLKNNRLIYPKNSNFELLFHRLILHFINLKFLKKMDALYEFGVGSCQNLIFFLENNKKINIFGSDWSDSSIKILKLIKKKYQKRFISFKKINMFKKFSLNIVDNSCLFTYCSMEQLGKDFKNFLNSSIKLNFKFYIHIEPINELSTKDKFGILSSKYIKKRNYLSGFLTYLKNIERKGIVKILYKDRIIGNSFFDCWSVIVWKKI
jgi:hypothetical protein